jgi:hypothetical protein
MNTHVTRQHPLPSLEPTSRSRALKPHASIAAAWCLLGLLTAQAALAEEPTSPLVAAAARAQAARARAATTTYTDADLERVRPQRDETGVASQPAFVAEIESAPTRGRAGRSARTRARANARAAGADDATASLHDARAEARWRAEARRVQTRVRALRARVQAWERRIDHRQRQPGVRPYSDPQIVEWQRQRDETERQARELEGDLDDRARRAHALPGWLR